MLVAQSAFPVAPDILVRRLVNHTLSQAGIHLSRRDAALTHALFGVRLNKHIAGVLGQFANDAEHVRIIDRQRYRFSHTRNYYGFNGHRVGAHSSIERPKKAAARQAKETLSSHASAALSLIGADGAAQQAILSRSQFAELGAALIARTLSANRIHQAMFKVGDMLETDAPLAALRAAAAALSAVTDEFAARRMNASISQALAGRRMDSLA